MKILTPLKIKSSIWKNYIIVTSPQNTFCNILEKYHSTILKKISSIIKDFLTAQEMYKQSRKCDIVITDMDRIGNFFSIMQFCFGKRIIHIMRGLRVMYSNNIIIDISKKIQIYIESKTINHFIVTSYAAIDYFSDFFCIPKNKFSRVLFHTTLNSSIKTEFGNYLFSGGNGNRDYYTLIKAVAKLNIKVVIAATEKSLFKGMIIPKNVEIRSLDPVEFRNCMAKSLFTVVALKYNKLHAGGEQTYLNSMLLSKPTIVTNCREASDYIVDGHTGFLVEPGDIVKLEEKIQWILNNMSVAQEIAKRGSIFAKRLDVDLWHKGIDNVSKNIFKQIKSIK